jgi:hypothetical protein
VSLMLLTAMRIARPVDGPPAKKAAHAYARARVRSAPSRCASRVNPGQKERCNLLPDALDRETVKLVSIRLGAFGAA